MNTTILIESRSNPAVDRDSLMQIIHRKGVAVDDGDSICRMASPLMRSCRFFLLLVFAASPGLHAESAATLYQRQVEQAEPGACIDLMVNLEVSPGFSAEQQDNGMVLRYRMAFNNIAEGWSWRPGADPQGEDYYRFKFLPLDSALDERGEYQGEDKIGVGQAMKIVWRYDYFLAFDNLYDFYPRVADDDAGFVLRLPGKPPAHPGMRAHACLEEPVISESTTFWKATYSHPTDFTLKKRYLIGKLESIEFVDLDTDESLGVLRKLARP